MPLLELRNLKKYYSGHKAVDDISFEVSGENIYGLLGPNGAGKTTLLRMITGIILPDEGDILFQGKPFDPMNQIMKIGYMPEERGLYKKMKIGEQALYLSMLRGMTKKEAVKQIKYWFEKFEMQSWWNKKVDDLSKGMGQKLQFVITVLHQPRLLILDEPFSGLDPVNSNLIKQEIFNLSKQGTTIIFSTHRMEQVEEICNKIILVNRGKKILDGDLTKIKEDFKENIFKIGFSSTPDYFEPQSFDIIEKKDLESLIRINKGYHPSDVLREYLDHGASIHLFNEILPSLNEIFIKQVNEIQSTPAFSEPN
ncbi:MAG: ATP-binding cassette domain-containing protein [Chitinophagaceae bacterium]|nr:ATP-binding cassette domain-containing protein [Chitinophagaceae bacterium]